MTDKELRKLKRHELLQLLLAQVKESEEIQETLEESQNLVQDLESTLERLKTRLDEKDAQIERLKARLDVKDERIRRLRDNIERYQKSRRIELNEAGNIAEAALRLNHIFEEAQKTAEQYLYNVGLMCGKDPDADEMDVQHLQDFLDGLDREERQEALEDEAQEASEQEVSGDEAQEALRDEMQTALEDEAQEAPEDEVQEASGDEAQTAAEEISEGEENMGENDAEGFPAKEREQ